jgi:hypothetical protein
MRTHAMVAVAPLLASVAIPVSFWFRPRMDEMLSTAFGDAQCQGSASQMGGGRVTMGEAAHCRCGLTRILLEAGYMCGVVSARVLQLVYDVRAVSLFRV